MNIENLFNEKNEKNEIIKKDIDFDIFYKTADILLCKNAEGIEYLTGLSPERKANLFKAFDENNEAIPQFYNWRKSINKSSNDGSPIYEVPNTIKLFPDNIKATMGYDYNLGIMSDITKSGVFGTIQNLAVGASQFATFFDKEKSSTIRNDDGKLDIDKVANNLQYQDRVNIFKNVPYFQDISTSSIDNISFTFNWGQYGLYNCELEVVKPIFALANCFGCSIDGNGFVKSPFDAKFEVTTKAYIELFKSGDAALSNALNKSATGKWIEKPKLDENGKKMYDEKTGKVIMIEDEQGTSAISQLTTSLNSIYASAVSQTSLTGALFRIGAGIFGPVYVSDVSWEFDYSQQDKYGMPFKGKITLGGIKPIIIEDMSSMALSGGVKLS